MFEAFLAAVPSGLSAVQNMFSSICCFACIAPAGLPSNWSFSRISSFINWWWRRWLWWWWLSLKRVLIGGGSGPVVTEGSDSTSVYEAAPPDPGITPSLHTLDLYLSLYFPSVARCNCIVGKTEFSDATTFLWAAHMRRLGLTYGSPFHLVFARRKKICIFVVALEKICIFVFALRKKYVVL